MEHMGIEFTVIGIYMLFLVSLGFVFRKLNSNVNDYFRNGCQGTWWLVGMSTFMAAAGSGTFVAGAGVNYEAGFTAYSYGLIACASWFAVVIIAPWFRQMRCITPAEVIEKRYGTSFQQLYAITGILFGIVGSAVALWALGIFCHGIFGFDLQYTIIIIGLIVVAYATTGGSWAVMGTDFIQGMIMIPVLFLITALSWIHVGGLEGFIDKYQALDIQREWAFVKKPGVFPGDAYTWQWLLAMFLIIFPTSLNLGAAVRFFSTKDGRGARKSAWLGAWLNLLAAVTWCVPAFVARLMYHDEVMATELGKPAEAAYAVIATHVLPTGLIGLMVVAIFAAAMSSLDTGINRNAAMLVQDVYPWICRLFGFKEWHGKARLALGKVFSLLSGATLILIALYLSSVDGLGMFEWMMTLAAFIGTPLGVPLILGLFFRRVPEWSGIFSICCGFVASVFVFLVGRNIGTEAEPVYLFHAVHGFFQQQGLPWLAWPFRGPWLWAHTVYFIWGASVLSWFATMFFWKTAPAAYREKVNVFFQTMHTPVDYEKEVGEERDLSQLQIIGTFTMIVGVFVLCLMLIPHNTWPDRLAILAVACFILGVGLWLTIAGIRYGEAHPREMLGLAEAAPPPEVDPQDAADGIKDHEFYHPEHRRKD